MSYGRHAGPAPWTARQAAVMLLLFRRNGNWYLPLTERPATLTRHAGQISLPGGALDTGETPCQAALRELREELGIDRGVEVLGRLDDCYVFASDFLVSPWVATVEFEPHWTPHVREVQSVVELPVDALLDEANYRKTTIARGPLIFHAPCIEFAGSCIWGVTSVILAELGETLRRTFRA